MFAKESWGASILRSSIICLAVVCLVAGCRNDTLPEVPLTRVKAVTTEIVDFAPTITLTGFIEARTSTDLSFRIGGKVSERLANIGDHVTKGQLLARLDPDEQESELVAAKAGVVSADATLRQALAAFDRQKDLLARGNTTRRDYDQADTDVRTARAQLDQAHSDLTLAESQLSYAELRADADGIIVDKHIEVGQVVAQAQPIFGLARDGARDAVFNVHEWALANATSDKGIPISLVSDPAVKTIGDVREVSPAVNPATETVSVKIALGSTPPGMTLGALVNGTAPTRTLKVVLLPWGSLFEIAGAPAVWVIDTSNGNTVGLKPITVSRYTRDRIAVASGLQPGEVVVSAGAQLLRPGQKVEIAAGVK